MTLLDLSEERASVEDSPDVIERNDEHQADQHGEAYEMYEPFFFRSYPATANQLDQDEEQPRAVERRNGKEIEECKVKGEQD
jgi:hypothetical protein